jgi:DNA polymerase-3 subunit delta'
VATSWRIEPWRIAPLWQADRVALGDLLGNPGAVAGLRHALDSGQLGHALLVTGPDQVGKTTLMLSLAAELLPRGSWPGDPAAHPDLWLEDSPEERISIRRVRAGGDPGSLQEFLGLRTWAGGARVAIIARADRLTEEAANSLLKTIEEPPPGTHLLLTAHSPERLPATVVSRCGRLSLGLVEGGAIEAWLRDRHGVQPETALLAAELGAGRPGRALRLAGDPEALRGELAVLDRFLAIGGGGSPAALEAAVELTPAAGGEGRERLLLNLSIWSAFVRDAAVRAAGAPELARLRSRRREADAWARALSPAGAGRILDLLLRASAEVASYAQPRLLLESLFLETFGGVPAPPTVA